MNRTGWFLTVPPTPAAPLSPHNRGTVRMSQEAALPGLSGWALCKKHATVLGPEYTYKEPRTAPPGHVPPSPVTGGEKHGRPPHHGRPPEVLLEEMQGNGDQDGRYACPQCGIPRPDRWFVSAWRASAGSMLVRTFCRGSLGNESGPNAEFQLLCQVELVPTQGRLKKKKQKHN